MDQLGKKFTHEQTKGVNIRRPYGSIALSKFVDPTRRTLRQEWHKTKKKKFFNFTMSKMGPIMKKYKHLRGQQTQQGFGRELT